MALFVELRALAGLNYVRAQDVIAVQFIDPQKCTVMMAGGATLPCSEPAKQVAARITAALTDSKETADGDASR